MRRRAAPRAAPQRSTCGGSRVRPALVARAEEVALAELDAVVTQDRVGRRDVEEHVRERGVLHVGQPLELERALALRHFDVAGFRALWRESGNMSGASRAASSTDGSILRCVACARPFSSSAERLPRVRVKTSTVIACIEIMGFPFRASVEKVGRRF